MKCSNYCPHTTNCPGTGRCSYRVATEELQLISTQDLLVIHLESKTGIVPVPEVTLTLPNSDSYNLMACVDHSGENRQSGHYTCKIKSGHKWFRCNDAINSEI